MIIKGHGEMCCWHCDDVLLALLDLGRAAALSNEYKPKNEVSAKPVNSEERSICFITFHCIGIHYR